jgi:hypothetical protein
MNTGRQADIVYYLCINLCTMCKEHANIRCEYTLETRFYKTVIKVICLNGDIASEAAHLAIKDWIMYRCCVNS